MAGGPVDPWVVVQGVGREAGGRDALVAGAQEGGWEGAPCDPGVGGQGAAPGGLEEGGREGALGGQVEEVQGGPLEVQSGQGAGQCGQRSWQTVAQHGPLAAQFSRHCGPEKNQGRSRGLGGSPTSRPCAPGVGREGLTYRAEGPWAGPCGRGVVLAAGRYPAWGREEARCDPGGGRDPEGVRAGGRCGPGWGPGVGRGGRAARRAGVQSAARRGCRSCWTDSRPACQRTGACAPQTDS